MIVLRDIGRDDYDDDDGLSVLRLRVRLPATADSADDGFSAPAQCCADVCKTAANYWSIIIIGNNSALPT